MIRDIRLLVALGVTGAAALALEVIWSRALIPWVGGTAMAQVATVGVYMLGLFAGSAVATRYIKRIRNPRQAFIRVEAAAALVSVLMILGLPLADPIFSVLAQGPLLSGGLGASLRGLAGGSLIFPATFLMGFGFPMAIASYQNEGGGSSSAAWIYGTNTVGAAIGAFLGGFVLVPQLGLIWGSLAVVAVDLVVLFWAGGGRKRSSYPVSGSSLSESSDNSIHATRYSLHSSKFEEPAMLLAVFIGGFVALALEVVLFRVLGLILGPTARAFTVVVTSYVLGLGLGSLAVGQIIRKGTQASRLVFIGSWVLAGTLVFCVHVGLGILPKPISDRLLVEAGSFGFHLSIKALTAAILLIPLTAAFGAAYAGAVGAGNLGTAHRAGRLYAVLTLGNVFGLLAAAVWILPNSGLEGGLLLLGSLAFLVAPMALLGSGMGLPLAGAIVILSGAAALTGPKLLGPWNWKYMNSGPYMYRSTEFLESSRFFLFLRHGFESTVAVMKAKENKFFSIDGKVDGSNRQGDKGTQSMAGLLGPLFHPSARTALVIGLGTGQTVAEVLRFSLDRVDCAEILPAITEILPFFKVINREFWTDSRYHLLQADGRTVLRYGSRDYDIIVSEPSNVWVPGVAQLFTREAFVEARESLRRPNGIFCQWLHAYRLESEAFKMVVRGFLDVFPHVTLWTTSMDNYDVLMVGSLEPLRVSQKQLERRLAAVQVKNYRVPGQEMDPESFLRTYIGKTEVLKKSIGPGVVLRQSRPRLEYMAEKALYRYSVNAFNDWVADISSSAAELIRGPIEESFRKTLARRAEANREIRKLKLDVVRKKGFRPGQTREIQQKLIELIQEYPDDPELHSAASSILFRWAEDIYKNGNTPEAEIYYLKALELWPKHRSTLKALALLAMGRQDFERAHRFQRIYAEADPGFMPSLILGDILRAQGRYREAVTSYLEVLEQDPQSVHSMGSLVSCFLNLGKWSEAASLIRTILQLDPGNAFATSMLEKFKNL